MRSDEAGDVTAIHRQIAQSDDSREVVALVARLRRLMLESAGDIVSFTHAAASADAEVGDVYAAGQASSRAGIERVTARLESLGALRQDLDARRAADAAYAILHHAVWTRLIDECGWSAYDAERWYGDILARALLEQCREPQRPT